MPSCRLWARFVPRWAVVLLLMRGGCAIRLCSAEVVAGSMKKGLFEVLAAGHEGLREVVGDEAGEPDVEETSYSAKRQASEQ